VRKDHAAVVFEDHVYVMGGCDGVQNVILNSCEFYNVKKDEWRYFQPMKINKCAFSATVVNSKFIYTFGGYNGSKRLDEIERYLFAGGDW
jgi:N-acetylneuraminic acid mutarotase